MPTPGSKAQTLDDVPPRSGVDCAARRIGRHGTSARLLRADSRAGGLRGRAGDTGRVPRRMVGDHLGALVEDAP